MGYAIDAGAQVGHVHLKVADLDRAVAFYRDVLGLDVKTRMGNRAAFLAAGDYHHHIGLNTWQSAGGDRPAAGTTGLFHAAFVYPTRPALARAVAQVIDSGTDLTGAADHGVSEAVYLDDPDGNGLELYWDRPRAQWPMTAAGDVALVTEPLDMQGLLREAS